MPCGCLTGIKPLVMVTSGVIKKVLIIKKSTELTMPIVIAIRPPVMCLRGHYKGDNAIHYEKVPTYNFTF